MFRPLTVSVLLGGLSLHLVMCVSICGVFCSLFSNYMFAQSEMRTVCPAADVRLHISSTALLTMMVEGFTAV